MLIQYFSHSTYKITTKDNKVILIDPFISQNPTSPFSVDDLTQVDYIVLSHGHGDHFGDTIEIAKKFNATVIAVKELADYCAKKGLNVHEMHIGGGFNFDFGRVKFTIAHHGSSTIDGFYAGDAAGILLTIEGKKIYHCGDTSLFYDMKLIGEAGIDLMLVPIGDNYTMGIEDAVVATKFVNPKLVVPMHYNTWPVIVAEPEEFVSLVSAENYRSEVWHYGEEFEL